MKGTPRHFVGIAVLIAIGLGIFLYAPAQNYAVVVALVGVGILLYACLAAPAGPALDGFPDALRRAMAGERPQHPQGATPELARVYDELASIADRRARETAEATKRTRELDDAERTLEEVAKSL